MSTIGGTEGCANLNMHRNKRMRKKSLEKAFFRLKDVNSEIITTEVANWKESQYLIADKDVLEKGI